MRRLALYALIGFGLGGCSWSSFTDLGDEMWVHSEGGADGIEPSSFSGVAAPGILPAGKTGAFVALGRSTDSVGEYDFDDSGVEHDEGIEIRAGTIDFGPLALEAPIAGDPYSGMVGVAAVTGSQNQQDTKIESFDPADLTTAPIANDFNAAGLLDGPIQPTGLVYAQTDDDTADLTLTDAVIARGPQIAIVPHYATSTVLAGCYGLDANAIVPSVGAGKFDANPADDELIAITNDVAGTAPEAIIFHGRAITTTWNNDMTTLRGCFVDGDPDRGPLARVPGPPGDPSWGKHVVTGDFDGDGDLDFAVSSPGTESVTAYLNDGALTFAEVDVTAPADAGAFGASLVAGDLDDDGFPEIVVGAPNAKVDGVTHAGEVIVYQWDGTKFSTVFTAADIQPETEQRLGTSAAVVPWGTGGQNILVVGADHELFVYFQTQLYDDVRQ
jgi:hypothetical protein